MKVNHHSAAVFVFPEVNQDRMLLGVYDEGYPVEVFRGHYCPIGGNASRDVSPRATLVREVTEELSQEEAHETLKEAVGVDFGEGEHIIAGELVAAGEMALIRDAIIESINPFSDYSVNVEGKPLGKKSGQYFLAAIYQALIPVEAFELAEARIREGKQLRNEGYTRILTVDEASQGIVRGSWGYGAILEDVLKGLGMDDVEIPEYDFVRVERFGMPLDSYAGYKARGVEYNMKPNINPED